MAETLIQRIDGAVEEATRMVHLDPPPKRDIRKFWEGYLACAEKLATKGKEEHYCRDAKGDCPLIVGKTRRCQASECSFQITKEVIVDD